jgi:hypothetical protein
MPVRETPPLDAIVEATEQRAIVPQTESAPPAEPTKERDRGFKPYWEDPDWIEMAGVVRASLGAATNEDAKRETLVEAGLVLVAGIWTRTGPTLRKMTGVSNEKPYVRRCYESGLWSHDNRGVNVDGCTDADSSDAHEVGFVLNAMVVAGDLKRDPVDGAYMVSEREKNAKHA